MQQTSRSVCQKLQRKSQLSTFMRLSGSYSFEVHPNGQPVTLPTQPGFRDAHAQTAL